MKFFTAFLLWGVLLVFCWPLALLLLVAFPIVWLICLPFRLGYWLIEGVLGFIRGLLLLPARVLGGGRRPCR